MRDSVRAIMQQDEKRRKAREIEEYVETHFSYMSATSGTIQLVNPDAPAWRNPELHGATTLEPTHAKRPYKRTRAQATRTPRRVPAFAGSLSQLDLARTGAVKLHPNAVKVINADGSTEIRKQSSYRAKTIHTRQTHAPAQTTITPTTPETYMPEAARLPSIHVGADDAN